MKAQKLLLIVIVLFLFGTPVRADVKQVSKNSLPLSPLQPPRELTTNAEVILISGYEPANKEETIVNVEVNRPGSRVLLVLTSYEQIKWKVSASPSTTITGIVTSGYKTPSVETSIPTQVFLVKLPYAYETESINFKELLTTLNGWFDINKVDVFRGSYAIPSLIKISVLDPPSDELTLSGPSPQKPGKNFTFYITTADFQKVAWSLTGPVDEGVKSYIEEGRIAVAPSGKKIYRVKNDDEMDIFNQPEGSHTTIPLPSNFPEFSYVMDIAYDTKRDIVSIVTLGGEGFLYRFDAKKKQWIDFRSLNNIDIYSLYYDQSKDRYVAWTDRGNLLFISGDGNALFEKKVISKLTGFGRSYDRGNSPYPSPHLTIAPNGDDIALIYINKNSVKNIWYYNVENDTAALTYRN